MRLIVLFFLLTGTLCANAIPTKGGKFSVLSTIKPIHLIVSEIVKDGVGVKAKLLIPENTSPHDYSFKPSDILKIKQAAIIFRIDEHFESILSPALEAHSSKDKLVSLAELKGVHLLSLEARDNNTREHGHDHSNPENIDLHIWTSPENALVMAEAIAKHLSAIDAEHKKDYEINLKTFKLKIAEEIKQTKEKLQDSQNKPSVVFNNTWRYFSDYFKLKEPIIINRQEGQAGNIRAIVKIRKEIAAKQISCLFSDPSVNPARVQTILENQNIKTAELDILAAKISPSDGGYSKWFESFSTKIENCLRD